MQTNNASTASTTRAGDQISRATDRVRKQLDHALDLAGYAIESGAKTADGDPLPFEDIATIHTTAAKLGALADPQGDGSITTEEWNNFELAYYRLAAVMSPVSAETLQDTEGTSRALTSGTGTGGGGVSWTDRLRAAIRRISGFVLGFSPAQRFARGLWLVAIGFALFVILTEWRIFVLGQEADVAPIQSQMKILEALIPWAYGGLGSCAYLLRSAHMFIYRRSFDLRRKPEYFNRILLGSISGGTIMLFTKYLIGEEGGTLELGAAALGFIAGYSTDFLFNTIERIVSAVFPKVNVETVPTPSTRSRPPGNLPKLDNSPDSRDVGSRPDETADMTAAARDRPNPS